MTTKADKVAEQLDELLAMAREAGRAEVLACQAEHARDSASEGERTRAGRRARNARGAGERGSASGAERALPVPVPGDVVTISQVFAAARKLRARYRGQAGPSPTHGFMFERLDQCHDRARTWTSRQRLRGLSSACDVLARNEDRS